MRGFKFNTSVSKYLIQFTEDLSSDASNIFTYFNKCDLFLFARKILMLPSHGMTN